MEIKLKGTFDMNVYDKMIKWRQRFSILISSVRTRIMFYKKVKFTGLISIHHTVKLYGRSGGTVFLGDRVFADRQSVIVAVGGKLTIGDHTFINSNCTIVSHERIDIGSDCMFGPNVCVYDHDHKFGFEGVSNDYNTSEVTIGDNCWIGANTVILRGTHIGDNSVIGAGTVVKGDIPPHSIVYSARKLTISPIEKTKGDMVLKEKRL